MFKIFFLFLSSFSESYFAVKGAALILPQSEFPRTITKGSNGGTVITQIPMCFLIVIYSVQGCHGHGKVMEFLEF